MKSPAGLVFFCLAAFLVLFPLAVGRPGMPVTLKADEPAYYGMALSLAHDLDVVCDGADVRRIFDRYPYLPLENLILMSTDGWRTIHYGKPYVYPLIAAPAAAFAGDRGMVALNMLLLLAMAAMGRAYLRRFNPDWLATVFAAAFYLLSAAFAYVFWLQPEVLNMAAVATCCFLAFHDFEAAAPRGGRLRAVGRRLLAPAWLPLWSGAVLAVAVYHKPMLAPIGLAPLVAFARRRGWRAAATWVLGAVLGSALLAGGSIALTGQASAYLGADRLGVRIEDPARFDDQADAFRALSDAVREPTLDRKSRTFSWLVAPPDFHLRHFLENLGYFLWGRHTGLLLYLPFGAIAIALFLVGGPRTAERWVLLAAAAAVGLYFLVWIHFNWHGGSGFLGNRYFIYLYPALLFLVTRVRPYWVLVPGFAAAGLFLAPILFTPYGAPVPRPTLQSHVRGAPFELFPLEHSVRNLVPGYETLTASGVVLRGRQDLFHVEDAERVELWVWGAAETEIWIEAAEPIDALLFEVASPAAENEVVLEVGAARRRLVFDVETPVSERTALVTLEPGAADRVRSDYGRPRHLYRLRVTTASGRNPRHADGQAVDPQFYVGAVLRFLGTRGELAQGAGYRIGWRDAEAPASVAPGERFEVTAWVRNQSDRTWSSEPPLPDLLSSHWLDAERRPLVFEGPRTALAAPLGPGEERRVRLAAVAPERPGRHLLVLDAVREQVGWFSRLGGRTLHLPVEVAAPAAER